MTLSSISSLSPSCKLHHSIWIMIGIVLFENGLNLVNGFVISTTAVSSHKQVSPFNPHQVSESTCSPVVLCAKGFGGGGGFGKSSGGTKKKKKSTKEIKRAKEQLLEQYGGDVARGTSERIQQAMQTLEPHVQLAAQLYQQVKRWDSYVSKLSVLEQTKLPAQDMEGAQRAKEQLEGLYQEYPTELSDQTLHNLFQKLTWDASADAKAARALMGNMPKHIQERVDRACSIIADAVKASSKGGRCLDVGCGPGVLVPNLVDAGVPAKQIYGIDLSTEMIRNAQRTHRGPHFVSADFFEPFGFDKDGFDGILFCSSLHDLPNAKMALERASSLLRPKGKLVVVHAQGASHVAGQHKANPVMVKNVLPTEQDLIEMDLGLVLEVAPVTDDDEAGYLAVFSNE